MYTKTKCDLCTTNTVLHYSAFVYVQLPFEHMGSDYYDLVPVHKNVFFLIFNCLPNTVFLIRESLWDIASKDTTTS